MLRFSRIIFSEFPKHTCFVRNATNGSNRYALPASYPTEWDENSFVKKIQEEKSNAVKEGRFEGFIPIDQLNITYSTGSDRTGTNNLLEVKSHVQVKFRVANAEWLPKNLRDFLMKQINLVDSDGCIRISSNKSRKQMLNQADCLHQLRQKLFVQFEKLHNSDTAKQPQLELDENGERIRQTYKGIPFYRPVPVDLETKKYTKKFKYPDTHKKILDSRLLEEQRYFLSKHKTPRAKDPVTEPVTQSETS